MRCLFPLAIMAAAAPAAVQAQDAKALAAQIAQATVQPEKAVADSAAQFDKEFDGGVVRGAAGRTITPAMRDYLAKVKAAGREEMIRQLRADAVPKMLTYVEGQYLANFSPSELRRIAEFWTSPAGLAWTAAMQLVALQGGGAVTPPPEHASTIVRYMNSDIGRRESAGSNASRAEQMKQMGDFMARVRPKLDAAMATVGRPRG
jgi:hypothetical protein